MFKWKTLLLREQPTEGSPGVVTPPAEGTTIPSPEQQTQTETKVETPVEGSTENKTPTPESGTEKKPASSIAGGIDEPKPPEGEEKKPVEGEKKEGDADKKTDDEAVKDVDGNPIPEAYEFKLPDGYVANEELTTQAQSFFKDNKFSPAQAQAAIDFHAEYLKKHSEAWIDTVVNWEKEAKSDKEFGGKNYDANVGVVRKVISEYGDDDLRQVLNDYGIGNHPAVLRSYLKIGQALGEAGAPKPETSNGGQESLAQVFYGGAHPKG